MPTQNTTEAEADSQQSEEYKVESEIKEDSPVRPRGQITKESKVVYSNDDKAIFLKNFKIR